MTSRPLTGQQKLSSIQPVDAGIGAAAPACWTSHAIGTRSRGMAWGRGGGLRLVHRKGSGGSIISSGFGALGRRQTLTRLEFEFGCLYGYIHT